MPPSIIFNKSNQYNAHGFKGLWRFNDSPVITLKITLFMVKMLKFLMRLSSMTPTVVCYEF